MVRNLFYAFLLLGSLLVGAASSRAQSYHFRAYSVREGLAQSNVYSAMQDREGYIWLGTASGVSRFDGQAFVNYTAANGLAANGVRSIFQDSRGIIWLGHSGGGVSIITPDTMCSVLQLSGDVPQIIEDESGGIWAVSTATGIAHITNASELPAQPAASTAYKGAEGLSDRIFATLLHSDGRLFFVTDVGIKQFDRTAGSFSFFVPEGLPQGLVPTCMAEGQDGSLWLGTHNQGVLHYNEAQHRVNRYNAENGALAHNFVSTLSADSKGNMWVGTWGGGLARLGQTGESALFGPQNGLPDRKIRCILPDAEGNILIGTNESGLQVFKGGQFVHYTPQHGLPDEQVWAISHDALGRCWIGTTQGVAIFDPTAKADSACPLTLDINSGLPNNNVRFIRHAKRTTWIGTWGGGVIAYDWASGQPDYNFELNYAIQFGNVTALEIEADGSVWVGTIDGLLHLKPSGEVQRITQQQDAEGNATGLPGNDIASILVQSPSAIWVGSRGKGLTLYNPQKSSFTTVEGTAQLTPDCLLGLANGDLLVGTESAGLLHISGQKIVKRWNTENGLPSNFVTAINAINEEEIWVGTNRGIAELSIAAGLQACYGPEDGFTGIEVKPNAFDVDANGNLWIGTVAGITVNRPQLAHPLTVQPNLHLTGLLINLENQKLQPELNLSYREKNLVFSYKAVSLRNPEGVTYQVMLEGLEQDWRQPTAQTSANYSGLPPGHYTFMVKATNSAGISAEPVSLPVYIAPPFWQTWWFYTLCVLMLAVAVYGWVKLREQRLHEEKERLAQLVTERTAEVVQQKEALAEANNELEAKNRDIMDSIHYAERIQRAILPLETAMQQHLDDVFVFFQPKDVVSGDFYWFAASDSRIYFSAIDCTGHGVPGAFVSLIGNNGLQKAVNELQLQHPNEILDALRTFVVDVFSQQGARQSIRDGMDMALCAYDLNARTLEFAGAKNPLYIVRNGEVEVIKGDKMPVGASETDEYQSFNNHQLTLQKGDCVYLFSDGFADQFGGPKGKKFKYRPFQQLLAEMHNRPMQEQKEVLASTINEWMAHDGTNYEQIDDILVMGVRF